MNGVFHGVQGCLTLAEPMSRTCAICHSPVRCSRDACIVGTSGHVRHSIRTSTGCPQDPTYRHLRIVRNADSPQLQGPFSTINQASTCRRCTLDHAQRLSARYTRASVAVARYSRSDSRARAWWPWEQDRVSSGKRPKQYRCPWYATPAHVECRIGAPVRYVTVVEPERATCGQQTTGTLRCPASPP